MPDLTVYEAAEELRCSPRKISDVATEHGIGANLRGRAGWRFTLADLDLIRAAMRPAKKTVVRRRRRSR